MPIAHTVLTRWPVKPAPRPPKPGTKEWKEWWAKQLYQAWLKWLKAHPRGGVGGGPSGGFGGKPPPGHTGGSGGHGGGNGSSGGSGGSGGGGSGSGSGNGGDGGGSGSGSGGDNGGDGGNGGNGGSGGDSGNGGGNGGNGNNNGGSTTSSGGHVSSTPPPPPGGHHTPTYTSSSTGTLSSTSPLPSGTFPPPAEANRPVNTAAIVAPVVVTAFILFLVGAWLVWRHRRERSQLQPIASTDDVTSFVPDVRPDAPRPLASLAARLRGGAPAPVRPRMLLRDSSYAVTIPGTSFNTTHPFSPPLHLNSSGEASDAAAHGHSAAPRRPPLIPFPASGSSSDVQHGPYGHRHIPGASASESIVGSGVFSLASAHHGHGGGTPGVEIGNPFGDPAPTRPYSVAETDDSRSDSQLGQRADLFIPSSDAPPVPPKPASYIPGSPTTPGSAHPLLGQSNQPATQTPFSMMTQDSYFADVSIDSQQEVPAMRRPLLDPPAPLAEEPTSK